jgi:hypothetical protein
VYLAAVGTYTIKSQAWDLRGKEGRFGGAIRVVGTIQAVIPAEPFTFAPITTTVEATGVIGTSEDQPVEITADT